MAQATTPVDWTTESDYWRKSYRTRPYVEADRDYDYYEPAYRYGFESETQYRGRSWDDVRRIWNADGTIQASWKIGLAGNQGCRARSVGSRNSERKALTKLPAASIKTKRHSRGGGHLAPTFFVEQFGFLALNLKQRSFSTRIFS